MDVIPVIDIKNGQVVHAQGGHRDGYRPIRTKLSATSEPADVAVGLLGLFRFRSLYIADLDAIEGRAANDEAIEAIAAAVPGVELWVDNGIADLAAARNWLEGCRHSLVIGSESQRGTDTVIAMRDEDRVLLSLDFRGDALQGPMALLDDAAIWPGRLIVMTLANVGAAAGPDIARVTDIVARAGGKRVFGAGGVRHVDDLRNLSRAGAAGVLVATALHSGAFTACDLEGIARP